MIKFLFKPNRYISVSCFYKMDLKRKLKESDAEIHFRQGNTIEELKKMKAKILKRGKDFKIVKDKK